MAWLMGVARGWREEAERLRAVGDDGAAATCDAYAAELEELAGVYCDEERAGFAAMLARLAG